MATILVADDEEQNRFVMRRMLQHAGHEVVMAENGKEVLAMAAQIVPDLILLDMSMPFMSGWDTVNRLKKQTSATIALIPVIAVTAHALPGDRERALAAGCNEYLSKPFDFYDMLRLVDNQLIVARSLSPHVAGS